MSNVDSKTIILNFLLLSSWSQKILLLKLTFQKNFVVFFKLLLNRSSCRSALALVFFGKFSSSLLVVYSWTRPLCAVYFHANSDSVPLLDINRRWRRHSPLLASKCENRQLRQRDGNSRAGTAGTPHWQASAALSECRARFLWLRLLVCRPCGERARAHALRGYKFTKKRPDIQGAVLLRWRYC